MLSALGHRVGALQISIIIIISCAHQICLYKIYSAQGSRMGRNSRKKRDFVVVNVHFVLLMKLSHNNE